MLTLQNQMRSATWIYSVKGVNLNVVLKLAKNDLLESQHKSY